MLTTRRDAGRLDASARMIASSGVSGAGLRTTVAPAASAGASFSMVTKSGTFHGTMATDDADPARGAPAHGPSMPGRTSLEGILAREVDEVVEHHDRGHHLPHAGETRWARHLPG
jgi:hypothetical protein